MTVAPTSMLDGKVVLYPGDCLDVLAGMDEASVDSVVTDPPYHLGSIVKRFGKAGSAKVKKAGAFSRTSAGFMNQKWDGGDIAFRAETWRAALRVLKPGGYLVAFASSRGFGRMSVAIEDAGFIAHPLISRLFDSMPEIVAFLGSLSVEQIEAFVRLIDLHDDGPLNWIFGSGFPKGHKVKARGYEDFRYGAQALKPAIEPIFVGQKPFGLDLNGTENVLQHGTGALNIGASLIGGAGGRYPSNVIHDGSAAVLAAFPDTPGQKGDINDDAPSAKTSAVYGRMRRAGEASADRRYADKGVTNFAALPGLRRADSGSAARFYYSAKADANDRLGSTHPAVKPLDLVRYLVRLVTPPGGTVLDLFAGTGTTGEAAWLEGMRAVLIEADPTYQGDIGRRMHLAAWPGKRRAVARTKNKLLGAEGTPLFGKEAAE